MCIRDRPFLDILDYSNNFNRLGSDRNERKLFADGVFIAGKIFFCECLVDDGYVRFGGVFVFIEIAAEMCIRDSYIYLT